MVDLFSGGNLRRLIDVRAGDHAVHLGVDHPAAAHRGRSRRWSGWPRRARPGSKKITQYTRYGTIVLSLVQSLGHRRWASRACASPSGVAHRADPGWGFRLLTMITLTTGTALIMWLGEQISEKGIGNGISLIIFAGIVVRLPSAIAASYTLITTGELKLVRLRRSSSS